MGQQGVLTMTRGAPHTYVSRVTRPPDFDVFWQGVLDQAAKVPLNPEIIPDRLRSSEDVKVYQIFYDSLDNVRVSGWYCLPKQRGDRLPAMLELPGYVSDPGIPKGWARRGYAALFAAPRGKVRSNRQFNPGYPGLMTHGIVDRDSYSYRGFYVDAWRAVDFLLSRSEVDPKRIGVTGSSQGGGLSIITAAMRSEIAAAAAGAPYLCGIKDAIQLTSTYPYEEINDYRRLYPDRSDDVEKTLAYFDGINFARAIECPIIVNIGLKDNICPPETGYAMFNTIRSADKKLYPYDGQGHDAGRHKHASVVERFFRTHLRPGRS